MQRALVGCGLRHPKAVLPGYTHLQRASAGPLLPPPARLCRDARPGRRAPAGSAGAAGFHAAGQRRAYRINDPDRPPVRRLQLGFSAVTRNSMDAVSDRDFIAEILFALSLLGVHLSRLSEDIILWASAEFAFIKLSDAHTTGSSLMPQKKNPDVAELTRGKSGRLIGNLVTLLTTMKGLPMTYNRDLQEDKEPLFDSIDTAKLALAVFTEMIDGMAADEPKMRAAAADPFLLATDLADYLVKRGVPFRQAHEVIGKLTAFSLQSGLPFGEIPLQTYQEFSDAFADDVFACLNLESALNARQAIGAPNPTAVARELKRWKKALSR
ncbi:MAG: argininosuccinate lyase [Verrucomicrobiales bacterium]